jgi:hypothetical protein
MHSVGFRRLHNLAQQLPRLRQAAEFCTLRRSAQPLKTS